MYGEIKYIICDSISTDFMYTKSFLKNQIHSYKILLYFILKIFQKHLLSKFQLIKNSLREFLVYNYRYFLREESEIYVSI